MGPTPMRKEALAGLYRLPENAWERQILGRLLLAHQEEFMQIASGDNEMQKNIRKTYQDVEREILARGMLEGERKGLLEGERKGLLEGERKGLLEGERKGLLEGERKGLLEALQMTYRTRFGQMPSFIEHIGIEQDPSTLGGWLPVFLTGSQEDIARAVSGKAKGKKNGAR
jgi:hypothetical protein